MVNAVVFSRHAFPGAITPGGWPRRGERKFLGFSFTAERESRIRIAIESRRRLTARIRELQHSGRGQSLTRLIKAFNPLLRGWIGYFQISETPSVLKEL